jgi:hypothetical protein
MTKLKLLIFMLILKMKTHASCEPDKSHKMGSLAPKASLMNEKAKHFMA